MSPLVWLITGTSSGFGLQLAKTALSRGDRVIATSRNASKLAELQALGAYTVSLDVCGSDAAVAQVVDTAVKELGQIDVLVNNAGYILTGPVEACSADEVQAHFECNVFGALRMVRSVLPHMRSRKTGVIANIGSIAGWSGGAGFGIYNATKFSLVGITEAMKLELAPLGIDVTIIEPGYFRTDFLSSGSQTTAQKVLKDYDESFAPLTEALKAYNHKQPGDPVKGCNVIADALRKESAFSDIKSLPARMSLGSDSVQHVSAKIKELKEQHEKWAAATSQTDCDDVKAS